MNAKIDFSLSGRFNVVEHTVFHLVLGNVKDVRTIRALLPVYSDAVIANAIKRLVNFQIIHVNLETHMLSVSDPLQALIEKCLEHSQHLEVATETEVLFENGTALIKDELIKRQILNALLPGVNVGFLAKSIDFILCERIEG